MDFDWQEVLAVPIVAGLVGLVVWFFQSRIETIKRETERLQDERRKVYMQVLDPYIRILVGIKNSSETRKALNLVNSIEYRRASFELNLMGSDEVVRALNELMQYIYRIERDGPTSKPETMILLWGRVLLAIRKDLGNKRTKLEEIDMLEGYIKDIDKVRNS